MRLRTRYAVGLGAAAAMVLSTFAVGTATASGPEAVAYVHSSAASGTPTLAGLCGTAEGTWASDGMTAQDGAPLNPALDTWTAKHVKCTKKKNKINQLVVAGYPNQSMDIPFNVEVFKNKNNPTIRYPNSPQPDDNKASICSYTGQPGTFAAAGVSGAQWTIDLDSTCKFKKKVGKKGVWIAIQASLDQTFGQWFHATQTTADNPDEGDWADTGNLFGLGCVSFQQDASSAQRLMQDCIFGGDVGMPDFIMVLN